MIKAIMHGCSGKMGHVISEIVSGDEGIEIVCGVDVNTDAECGYPVFSSLSECDVKADVIIDFSTAAAVKGLLDGALKKDIPVVLCTTGLSDCGLSMVDEASKKIAILRSANMSLGINTLLKLLKTAAGILSPEGYDIEIVEKHHGRKLDAPSGTAIALADAVNDAAGGKYEYVFDRSERRQKRPENEIGISSVRGGTIVGEHEVLFCGTDEVIEIKHTAYSRAIFAKGAVAAAKFLAGKEAGMYSMSDVLA